MANREWRQVAVVVVAEGIIGAVATLTLQAWVQDDSRRELGLIAVWVAVILGGFYYLAYRQPSALLPEAFAFASEAEALSADAPTFQLSLYTLDKRLPDVTCVVTNPRGDTEWAKPKAADRSFLTIPSPLDPRGTPSAHWRYPEGFSTRGAKEDGRYSIKWRADEGNGEVVAEGCLTWVAGKLSYREGSCS